MTLVGSAEYVVETVGAGEATRDLQDFANNADRVMEGTREQTEATTQATGKSIVAYAALGAAMGVVFVDFIRQSSVMSTMIATWGTLFGATADIILIELMPAFSALTDVLIDFMDEVDKMPGSMKVLIGALGLLGIALVGVSIVGAPVAAALVLIALAAALVVNEWENLNKSFEIGGPWWERAIRNLETYRDRAVELGTAIYETSTIIAVNLTVALINAGTAIRDFFAGMPEAIIEEITSGFPRLQALGGDIANTIIGGFKFSLDTLKNVFEGIADWIRDLVTGGFPTLRALGADMFGAILGGFQDSLGGAGGFFEGVANSIIGFFTGSPELHPRIARQFARVGSEMAGAIQTGMAGGVPAGGTAAVAVTAPPAAAGVGAIAVTNQFYISTPLGASPLGGPASDARLRALFTEMGDLAAERMATKLRRRM